MLILFEKFNSTLQQLQFSLSYEKINFKTIILERNGFLPPNTTSPWSWLCKWENNESDEGFRLSSLELKEGYGLGESTIDGVEILSSNDQVVAQVTYHNPTLKTISHISWFNKDGDKNLTQYYCSEGFVFATEYFYKEELLETIYTNREQKLVGIHYKTGEFRYFGSDYFPPRVFKSIVDFYRYSLNSHANRKKLIIYENSDACLEFIKGVSNQRYLLLDREVPLSRYSLQRRTLTPFKYIYDTFEGNRNTYYAPFHYQSLSNNIGSHTDILITTMTGKVAGLEELLKRNTWATFRIATPLEFSDKIKSLSIKYSNLHLFPLATTNQIEKLFSTSKIFLDISHGEVAFNSPVRAFSNNLLILGVSGISISEYITKDRLLANIKAISETLEDIHQNPKKLDTLIQNQQQLIGKASSNFSGWSKLNYR